MLSQDPTVISKEELAYCGTNYCPGGGPPKPTLNETIDAAAAAAADLDDNFSTSKSSLYTLAGIYLACSLLSAIVVALFVDPLGR